MTRRGECLVNGRIGNALVDYAETRDNAYPAEALASDWEVPATINDTWGFKTHDQNWKRMHHLARRCGRLNRPGSVIPTAALLDRYGVRR
jgi:alpha-L-fucosidase